MNSVSEKDVLAEALRLYVADGGSADYWPVSICRDDYIERARIELGRPTAKEEAAPGGVGEGCAVDVIAYGPVDGTGERHPEGSYIMLHVSKGNAHDLIRISKGAADILADEIRGIVPALAATPSPPTPSESHRVCTDTECVLVDGVHEVGEHPQRFEKAVDAAAYERAFNAGHIAGYRRATEALAAPAVEPVAWQVDYWRSFTGEHAADYFDNAAEAECMVERLAQAVPPMHATITPLYAGPVAAPSGPEVSEGELQVTVRAFSGTGKSALCGEIEILCNALGLPVEWIGGEQEKRLTHADWTASLELYKPRVVIHEVNVPRKDQ